jgi:flagellar biosynthetic protein FliR
MSVFETLLVGKFLTFLLVLTRLSGVILTAPLFSSQGAPMQFRALLAVSMAMLVAPLQQAPSSVVAINNLLELLHLMVPEVLVGLLLGLGLNIIFAGIQVAGQIISQMSGMSLADVFSPGFEANVSVFSQLFFFLTMAVFVSMGGHRLIIEAVLETYRWAPPGQVALGDNFVEVLTSILTQSFLLGIRAAAPILTALFLSTIVLGLISRTLPQLNIILVGFNLNALLTLGALFLSIGSVAWTFHEPTTEILLRLQEVVVSGK